MEQVVKSAQRLGDRRRVAPAAAIVRGTLLALLTGAGLLLLSAYLLYRTADPTAYTRPIAAALSALMGITGGAYAARRCGQGGVLAGLAVGAVLALASLLSALPLAGGALSGSAIPQYLLMLLAGALGGLLGGKRRTARRRRR